MTTVKVSKQVRSPPNEREGRRRLTADAYISELLEADEWAERMVGALAGMRSMSDSERDTYLAESSGWDITHPDAGCSPFKSSGSHSIRHPVANRAGAGRAW